MDNVPVSVYIENAKSKIVECINSLKVHPYLLEPILKDICNDIKDLKSKTYNEELMAYFNKTEEKKEGDTDG